ncbi:hypothetical protein [Streptomyces sp. S1]|uniref:hypothetical protein n=1 Tax=Streptomyces sp. S1 TaxID=718288 RepID=UPI003D75B736
MGETSPSRSTPAPYALVDTQQSVKLDDFGPSLVEQSFADEDTVWNAHLAKPLRRCDPEARRISKETRWAQADG